MTMCHKAYAFDWTRFDHEFRDRLEQALAANDLEAISAFVDENRDQCHDPYDGVALPPNWRSHLETDEIQELSDFALTKYYDPNHDYGLGDSWMLVEAELSDEARSALLGFPIGPIERRFDPGAMGAYFQTPSMVRSSLSALAPVNRAELQNYLSLLRHMTETGAGLYITF